MSALNQNYTYVFGKKKANAKERVIPKERMEEARKQADEYLKIKKNEVKS